ncbi:MAG: MarR family transcriptional regulator [Actinomycetota bacterium]|nr:MarR family transcriptional regulator [Actinomycetota bacterium]
MATARTRNLTDTDFQKLLTLRTELRKILRRSETRAKQVGITPAQHQLMLAIRGHGESRGPTITDAAQYLMLRHHSVVGLVDRAEAAGLVERRQDADDHRAVRLRLTRKGNGVLQRMNSSHADELSVFTKSFQGLASGSGRS